MSLSPGHCHPQGRVHHLATGFEVTLFILLDGLGKPDTQGSRSPTPLGSADSSGSSLLVTLHSNPNFLPQWSPSSLQGQARDAPVPMTDRRQSRAGEGFQGGDASPSIDEP